MDGIDCSLECFHVKSLSCGTGSWFLCQFGAFAAGAKVDLAALEKDHKQNADGLDRASGVVASGAVAYAGVEIYRYASKLGGMTGFAMNNVSRRGELEKTVAAPTVGEPEKEVARQEIAKIDLADADQKVLLKQVAGRA